MKPSANLALHEWAVEQQASGSKLLHMAFGEARLPVLPEVAEQLALGATRTWYAPVAGSQTLRTEVAGYFRRRGLPTEPDQVLAAPGSKPLLFALQLAAPGDVILPTPAWNSYAPQASLAGKRVLRARIPESCGGVPDPAELEGILRSARFHGADPRILVLTIPDNPTGTYPSPELVRELCSIAVREDLLVVSDEIYRDMLHPGAGPDFVSPAMVVPERTVVTTGLSKSLALGGWRVGVARLPEGRVGEQLRDAMRAIASEIWSTLASPMQAVAEYVFSEPECVTDRLEASARLHAVVATAVHDILTGAGAMCRRPTAAFYLYPDFGPVQTQLASAGARDSATLGEVLLARDLAVLPGHVLGDDAGALRCKLATGLLYGSDEGQQVAALAATNPLSLPHIERSLEMIAHILHGLADGCGGG